MTNGRTENGIKVAMVAKAFGVTRSTIYSRIRNGETLEEIIVKGKTQRAKQHEALGGLTVPEFLKKKNKNRKAKVKPSTLYYRLKHPLVKERKKVKGKYMFQGKDCTMKHFLAFVEHKISMTRFYVLIQQGVSLDDMFSMIQDGTMPTKNKPLNQDERQGTQDNL